MAKILVQLCLWVITLGANGQPGSIDTDRPDQTESAALVPRSYFQVEMGLNRENLSMSDYRLIHPTVLLRYGFKKIELRVEAVFHSDREEQISQTKWTTGLDPVELGIKAAIIEERRIIPKTSVIVHLGIPSFSSKAFRSNHLAPSFRLVTQKTFTTHFGVGSNLGIAWDGYASDPAWLYTFSPGFTVGEKWYVYLEAFGFIQKLERPQHNLDAGIAYYISQDAKLDLSAGKGISDAAPKNYFALGFSFRMNARTHHP